MDNLSKVIEAEAEKIEMSKEKQIVKFSACQDCGGWVRSAALDYFNADIKARNEFMREVAKYNLSVRELELEEWRKLKMCDCNG